MFSLVAKIANFASLIKRYERKQNIFLKVRQNKVPTHLDLCANLRLWFFRRSLLLESSCLCLMTFNLFNSRHLTQNARGPDVFYIEDLVTNRNVENN